MVLTNTNPITIGSGNFSFSTSAGTAVNNLTLPGAVGLGTTRTITLNGTGTLAFSGVLTNTYTAGRTLTVNNGSGTSSATLLSFGGYNLASTVACVDAFNGTGNVGITGTVADGFGSSGLTYSGSGTLTLSGANSYSGLTTVSSGTLVLSGSNSSAGATTLSGGTLQLASSTANNGGLASGALTLSGGTLQATSVAPLAVTNTVSLTTATTVSGAKNLALNGDLTETGSTILTSSITGGNTLTLGTVNIDTTGIVTGKTLTIAGTGNTTCNGVIQDYSGGVGTSHGALTIGNTAGTVTLAAANTYGGTTTVNGVGGTLKLSNQNALQNSTLTMSGGGSVVFDSSVGEAFNFGGLAASTAGPGYDIALQDNAVSPAAIALTVGGNNASTTYAGVLSGSGSLTKTGTGTLTLSGPSTYSGNTYLNSGGILKYAGTGVSSGGTITSSPFGTGTLVLNGGTLAGDATDRNVPNPVTIAADTVFGIANNVSVLHLQGAATLTGSHTLSCASLVTNASNLDFAGGIGESVSGCGLTLSMQTSGPPTVTFSGNNTYTGGTALLTGILALNNNTGAGYAIPAGPFDIGQGGVSTITTNYSNQFSPSAVLNFHDDTAASLTLQLANQGTYAGTTQTIGGLNSDGASTGSPRIWLTTATSGSFNSDATLVIQPASGQSYSWSGYLRDNYNQNTGAGTGKLNLKIDGPGTQIITNFTASSIGYTGTTEITAGSHLVFANTPNAMTIASSTITDNGSLTISQNGSTIYSAHHHGQFRAERFRQHHEERKHPHGRLLSDGLHRQQP